MREDLPGNQRFAINWNAVLVYSTLPLLSVAVWTAVLRGIASLIR